MALKGKSAKVQVSTDGAVTFNDVLELNDASITIDGTNLDITEFGDDFINRIQGLKDGSYSLGGFYAPGDTTGQVAIRDALLNDTQLHVQLLPDGVAGFQQEVKVASFAVNPTVDGTSEVSIDLEGTGTITTV